jgi:hypothetical protein
MSARNNNQGRAAMSFMQPQVIHAAYYRVETINQDTIIPADAAGTVGGVSFPEGRPRARYDEDSPEWAGLLRLLTQFANCQEILEVSPRKGWIARMSAPGYMDCTEWEEYESEARAWAGLLAENGDDEPGELTCRWLPASWASALVNGDYSGMSDEESADIHQWQGTEDAQTLDLTTADCVGQAEFRARNDANNLGADCHLFLFTVKDDE